MIPSPTEYHLIKALAAHLFSIGNMDFGIPYAICIGDYRTIGNIIFILGTRLQTKGS